LALSYCTRGYSGLSIRFKALILFRKVIANTEIKVEIGTI